MEINIVGILTWILTGLNMTIAVLVLFQSWKRFSSWLYGFVIFSYSLWSIATFFYNSDYFFSQVVWLKIVYLLAYIMVLAQIAFTYFFPVRVKAKFWLYIGIVVFTMIPGAYITLFTELVVVDAVYIPGQYTTIAQMGPGYFIHMLPNILSFVLLSFYFYKKAKNFTGIEKAQIQFYTIGSLFMYGPIIIIDYLIPLFTGYTALYRLGPLFVTPFTIIVAYSMIKTRFLGLRTIIGEILNFLVVTFFIFIGFYFFHYAFSSLFGSIYAKNAIVMSIIVAPVFTYLLLKFQVFLRNKVIKGFVYEGVDPSEEIGIFNKKISLELDLNKIATLVFEVFDKVFDVKRTGLILFNKEGEELILKRVQSFGLKDEEIEKLLRYWNVLDVNTVLFYEELRKKEKAKYPVIRRDFERVMQLMRKNNIYGLLPLKSKTDVRGVIILSNKVGEEAFTLEDVKVMDEIVSNVTVALGRAVLYEEVQKFSETLQQKVEKATEELRKQKTQLEETLRKERDMMDILGHELRTPLAVIRNGLAIVKMNLGKDPEKVEEWLEKSKEALMNEINIVDTVLASSRIAGERVEVRHEEVDLNKVIQKVFLDFETKAKSKGLYLQYEPIENSKVYADKGKVRQIFTNLVSNAVKYTNEGGLKARVYEKDNMLCTEFKDTGVGISREDLANLGKKFYRAKQYLNEEDKDTKLVRPGGTGLGLYISINLVRMMGGELRFDSELGKGSVFTVCLPKYSGQEIYADREVKKSEKEKSKDAFKRFGLKKNEVI